MVDPISSAIVPREIGTAQSRPQDSPASPSARDQATNLSSDQRLTALQATVERLLRLREHVRDLEGMLAAPKA